MRYRNRWTRATLLLVPDTDSGNNVLFYARNMCQRSKRCYISRLPDIAVARMYALSENVSSAVLLCSENNPWPPTKLQGDRGDWLTTSSLNSVVRDSRDCARNMRSRCSSKRRWHGGGCGISERFLATINVSHFPATSLTSVWRVVFLFLSDR